MIKRFIKTTNNFFLSSNKHKLTLPKFRYPGNKIENRTMFNRYYYEDNTFKKISFKLNQEFRYFYDEDYILDVEITCPKRFNE